MLGCVWFFATPWTVGISQARIPDWVAISLIFPTQGLNPQFPAAPALAGKFFTTETLGKPLEFCWNILKEIY